ncbi:CBN-TWK-37 protein [Caenorhabditis brenneri]|uniref:CBN-TWK-37 protein n=1 Tax=Caenorhabditis brenneri TaxID=135651 RepID=G0PC26_CAEBE|nr:CBN-TWK-37 protein [Caenorhabditis brenneri]
MQIFNRRRTSDGTHRHTDRIINKFMERKMENAPPETHHLVRKQSVFNFVERKEKSKPKPTNFKRFLKKVRINPPKQIKEYSDGIAYVITCITTIGYGQLVCYTIAGKLITVVYGIIGIALTIYVLRHNGKIALKVCNWILGLVAKCIRICGNSKVKFKMTVTKSFILLIVFWILGALGIASYENFVFWDAIYFSFSSFSTIGFGDLVPKSHTSGAIIFVLHFIDLSLLSMVFVLVHQTMENNFMRVLELLDEGYRKHTTELNTGTMNLQSPGGSKRNLDLVTTARE